MLKVLVILFFGLIVGVSFAYAQDDNLCNCWLAKIDRNVSSKENCKESEDLTDKETLEVMKCLLNQKGNISPHIGVVLRNDVSQTFGSSPVEVVALFYVSYLFYRNKDFANAMVLIYDYNDEKPNSRKAVKIAHKSYQKWFKKVETLGLKTVRERKLDPLENTKVSWY